MKERSRFSTSGHCIAYVQVCGVVLVTSSDYHIVMKSVGVADLKAKLSEHLRYVRKGRPLVVMDRNQPVARLVPFEPAEKLEVIMPAPGSPRPQDIPLPPPLDVETDVVAMLLEDRTRR
jgi:prevent-host-death family protein